MRNVKNKLQSRCTAKTCVLDAGGYGAISAWLWMETGRRMGSFRGRTKGPAFRKAIFLAFLICGPAVPAAGQVPVKADIGGDGEHTRYVAFLSKNTDFRIFSISDPYRVVVDLPETDIQVPAGGRGFSVLRIAGENWRGEYER